MILGLVNDVSLLGHVPWFVRDHVSLFDLSS